MFVELIRYQTGDGITHPTPQKAAQHVESKICDAINKTLLSVNDDRRIVITGTDARLLTIALYENRAAIRAALDLETFAEVE
jgi:hypothetical protein